MLFFQECHTEAVVGIGGLLFGQTTFEGTFEIVLASCNSPASIRLLPRCINSDGCNTITWFELADRGVVKDAPAHAKAVTNSVRATRKNFGAMYVMTDIIQILHPIHKSNCDSVTMAICFMSLNLDLPSSLKRVLGLDKACQVATFQGDVCKIINLKLQACECARRVLPG